ncbi:MAG: hypothetical protein QW265_03905 [Candidatus Bathyarchaeia archaeon]
MTVRFEIVKQGLNYVGANCPNCGFPIYLYFDPKDNKLKRAASYAEMIGDNTVRCSNCLSEFRPFYEKK